MRRRFPLLGLLPAAFAAAGAVYGQESPSYRMTEHVFNAGGRPAGGIIAVSPSFRMTVDSIGDSVQGVGLVSASFRMRPGFVASSYSPGEVLNVRFTDNASLVWDPNPSAGVYNMYRGDSAALPGTYGSCYQSGLGAAQAQEPTAPAPGVAWFYLVTVENPLLEEGTKGFTSSGAERTNPAPCP